MKNVEAEIDGDVLTIRVKLTENLGRSKSGKSIMIGSTEGIADVGGGIKVGLNVFRLDKDKT